VDIDATWEYEDPEGSEQRFQSALVDAHGDERLELLTQIARALGLRGKFGEAHALLDEVEGSLAGAGLRPRLRYLLERGRALNSAGDKQSARDRFVSAWEQAKAGGEVGLAVDAAHMVAITCSGSGDAIEWNLKGLELARSSEDAKARALIPAMLNNSAWDLHEMGRLTEALPLFEEAEAAWRERGKPEQVRIARWSVARCLRSLGRLDEAIAIQRQLEAEHAAAGTTDGFVLEELAELLHAQGRQQDARTYFARAAEELARDDWFVENETARLARLRSLAGTS
jgi:tetratricopeptide (TPR) repeat protein